MRIAVSACLLGEACRYDGKSKPCAAVLALRGRHELVAVCPEVLGGLAVPRPRAEIIAGAQGPSGEKRLVTDGGADVTAAYRRGAAEALRIYRERGCACAILKSRSPACGLREVHDGSFSEGMVAGSGVAAALFTEAGIRVYEETDILEGWQGIG